MEGFIIGSISPQRIDIHDGERTFALFGHNYAKGRYLPRVLIFDLL
jgi:hypothetical protein